MKMLMLILSFACFCKVEGYEFPKNFTFGIASSAYQVEGAWNESGKGENIWDHLAHTQDYVKDGSTGDIACDTYHKTKEDVQLLKNLGVDIYRFSLSWPRILPTGQINKINEDGVRYYNELIDALLAENIKPFVTIYHWDLPQALQELGGWPNPLLADYYVHFANLSFSLFGDRVKNWLTFNEPYEICALGYSSDIMAPAYVQEGIGGFLCGHTLLRAHAKAYRLYETKYKKTQKGIVGITLSTFWGQSASNSEADQEATNRYRQLRLGWFAHPIFSRDGDYPPTLRARIDALSTEEGYPNSRLPHFTENELESLKGSADFFGFNHYTAYVCTTLDISKVSRPSYDADVGANCTQPDNWESSASDWLKVAPQGFREALKWIKDQYNNPEIVVTENGFSDATGDLRDCRRINYHNLYLEALLEAIYVDNCNITAYIAWSFLDSFEWTAGYTERFGLHYVDFTDEDRPRRPKMSAHVYKNIIKTRKIDWNYTPEGFSVCKW